MFLLDESYINVHSPDLNLIKTVWRELKIRVVARRLSNLKDLKLVTKMFVTKKNILGLNYILKTIHEGRSLFFSLTYKRFLQQLLHLSRSKQILVFNSLLMSNLAGSGFIYWDLISLP
ncbi:hypothetical protein ATANTOWER_003757 [Ataeniobius toweri]|uniref:Uncharacterized protein n=1 Tax=Ataeniobius toweri TaxID=208326 RepID=A0ABU7CEI7_9TELE|nr:hypothetical protein [Ataeniobius toweri]